MVRPLVHPLTLHGQTVILPPPTLQHPTVGSFYTLRLLMARQVLTITPFNCSGLVCSYGDGLNNR
jgi:hypothetical protein